MTPPSDQPDSPSRSHASDWATNVSPDELAAWLKTAKTVAIFTHAKPDGDAAGSTLGLARTLRALGVEATCHYAGALPLWFDAFVGDTNFTHIDEAGLPADTDIALICDTGSWSQLEAAKPWLEGKADRVAILDHHLHGNAEIANRRWIATDAAAACQPGAHLATLLLGLDSTAQLPADIASCFYFGIGTDTGWFRHSNVNASVLDDAANLLRAGAQHVKLYTLSEQRDRPSRLRLMARALSSATFTSSDRAVLMTVSLADLSDAHAAATETGGIVEQSMSIESIRVGALLTEVRPACHPEGPLTKMSLRSKEVGEASVDVNLLAQRFGGGGHARAAGARHDADLIGTRDALQAAIEEALAQSQEHAS